VATDSERSEPPEGAERDWGDRSRIHSGKVGGWDSWDSPPETSRPWRLKASEASHRKARNALGEPPADSLRQGGGWNDPLKPVRGEIVYADAVRRSIVILALCASVVRADDTPVLHEYVPDAADDEVPDVVAASGGEPSAIVYDGELLPPPEGGPLRRDERAMSAAPGTDDGRSPPGTSSPTFRPDRVTSLEGRLGYYTVFTPTIAPFKRVSALDEVALDAGGVPVLGIRDPSSSPIAVEAPDAPLPDARPRDRFWGSVVLDFSDGARVPFPSVSPESRILSLRTEPPRTIEVEKDAADNFYARATDGQHGQVRVTFLTDAPRSYFNAERIPDVPSDALRGEVPPLDEPVRRDALAFAAETLGVGVGDALPKVLDALTEHFRSFVESDEPPPSSGNIFLDLSRGMRGVCRHRAYGFVITARALGLPARFVQNEAHAWVEVNAPELGWMRIDLGGAASALDAHGAEDRPVYRPEAPDPLPQPEPYRRSYSQLRGDVRGLRSDASQPPAAAPAAPDPDASAASGDGEPSEEAGDPIETLFSAPEPDRPSARPLRLVLDEFPEDVFRGRTLEVSGRALDPDGEGAASLRIEVMLRDRSEQLLGVTVTRDDGRFHAAVGVPPDLSVGEYRLVVRTPGNARFYPATAR